VSDFDKKVVPYRNMGELPYDSGYGISIEQTVVVCYYNWKKEAQAVEAIHTFAKEKPC